MVSNDWCFASVFAVLCAGAGSAVLIWIIKETIGVSRQRRIVVWLLPAIIGIACVRLSILSDDAGFEHVFGIPMPAGISDVEIQRGYAGGPGDEETILWFRASPETVAKLIAEIGLQPRKTDGLMDESTVQSAVEKPTMLFKKRAWGIWSEFAKTNHPEIFESDLDQIDTLKLLYDSESGLAVAMRPIG
jgi:hypothetical protein